MRSKRTREEFECAAKEAYSIAGMCRILGISRKSMCLSIDLCKSEQKVFNIRYTSQLHSEGFDFRVQ